MERIQKIIANAGYCSRRKAEELIEQGKVKLNGETAKLGDKATEEDKITIEEKTLQRKQENLYYILNKPKGILVTKTDPQNRRTIYNLKALKNIQHLNYVGRLDGASEGLLLLTNDGELNNQLTHPKHDVEKTYQVRTEPTLSKEDITKLKNGLLIEDRKFFAKISAIEKNTFNIKIKEGRNRIIRKALEKLNYKIYLLKRISIANISLGNLKSGEIKKIDKPDIK